MANVVRVYFMIISNGRVCHGDWTDAVWRYIHNQSNFWAAPPSWFYPLSFSILSSGYSPLLLHLLLQCLLLCCPPHCHGLRFIKSLGLFGASEGVATLLAMSWMCPRMCCAALGQMFLTTWSHPDCLRGCLPSWCSCHGLVAQHQGNPNFLCFICGVVCEWA